MRGKLFGSRFSEESVFRDESVLYNDHVPDILPHRENQIQQLANCMRPLTKNSKPSNIFVHGPTGVGKTAVSRFVLRELKEATDVHTVYINCWQHDTRHAVLTQLSYSMGAFAPRRGTATDEIYGRFTEAQTKLNKNMVVVLDEADRLLQKDGSQVIYDMLRSASKAKVALVIISNDQYALRLLDDRSRSSFNPEEVLFAAYDFDELKDILNERVKFAFVPSAVKPGAVSAIARFTADNGGDMRLALECLLRAGQLADNKGEELSTDHVKKVLDKVHGSKFRERMSEVTEEQKEMLKIIATGAQTSGQLFREFTKTKKIAERTFRKYVSDLEKGGFIKAEWTGKGHRGKSRVLTLRFPKEFLTQS